MRRYAVLLSIIAFITSMSKSQTPKGPDFAFPRNAVNMADSILKEAQKSGDEIQLAKALMIKTEAEDIIDHASLQKSYETILSAANDAKDEQIKSMLQLYAARIVTTIFDNNRWQYNRRELPLEPRPADMTEWSGDMFRAITDSLVTCAWENAGDMPLSKLDPIVEADRLTLQYYPTLCDFVAFQITENDNINSDLRDHVLQEVIDAQRKDSPAYYMWLSKQIVRRSQSQAQQVHNLLELYRQAGDKRAALVIFDVKDSFIYGDDKYKAEIADIFRQAIKYYPNEWITPKLQNMLAELEQPRVTATIVDPQAPGLPIKVSLTQIRNVDKIKLLFRRIHRNGIQSNNRKLPFTYTFDFDLGPKAVVQPDTAVYVTLPEGKYEMTMELNDQKQKADEMRYQTVEVNAFANVFVCGEKSIFGILLDNITGLPVKSALYQISIPKGKRLLKGYTDSDGIYPVDLSKLGKKSSSVTYTLSKNNAELTGDRYLSYRGKSYEIDPRQLSVTCTSDRGIYHLGETVKWMGIVANTDSVKTKVKLSVTMLDTEGNTVGEALKVESDDYGRINGEFIIPDEGKTGSFVLRAECRDKNYQLQNSHICRFMVSDFKPAVTELKNVYVVPDYAAQKGAVYGMLIGFNGAPVGNAKVNTTINMFGDTVVIDGVTGDDGKFNLDFDYPRKKDESFDGGLGFAKVTATTPSGEVLTSQVSFNIKYAYSLSVDLADGDIDAVDCNKPITLLAKLVDVQGKNFDASLHWSLVDNGNNKVFAEGDIAANKRESIELPRDLMPGAYRINVVPVDSLIAEDDVLDIVCYRTDTNKLPKENAICWMPKKELVVSGGKASVQIGVAKDATNVICVYVAKNGEAKTLSQMMNAGYSEFELTVTDELPENVTFVAVRDGINFYADVAVKKVASKEETVQIVLESFRDKVFAGAHEQWNLSFTIGGKPLAGGALVDVYDQRLGMLAQPMRLGFTSYRSYNNVMSVQFSNRGFYGSQVYELTINLLTEYELLTPCWRYAPEMARMMLMRKNSVYTAAASGMSVKGDYSMALDELPVVAEDLESVEEESDADVDFERVELRDGKQYTALWLPSLVMGKDGKVAVPLDVPNINTTWRVVGYAWTKDKKMARVDTTMVVSKPVMVAMNTPRFVRRGDTLIVPVNVTNNTDTVRTVTLNAKVATESNAPFASLTKTLNIPAGQSLIVPLEFTASSVNIPDSIDALNVTVRAISEGSSDGERVSVPVLTSESRVTESRNFYLNPGQSSITVELPRPQGADFEAELHYTANPMWTVVEALYTLTEDEVFSLSPSQAQSYFVNAIALGLMKKHPELELKFNTRKVNKAMQKALKNLQELQMPDGGMRWGMWSSKSDLYSSLAVLECFGILKRLGYYDNCIDKMIDALCRYLDANIRGTSIVYAIDRTAFGPITDVNGQNVVQETVNAALRTWKIDTADGKALDACVLWYNDNKNMARRIIESLDQIATQTPDKGFEFKNVTSLHTYALLLEAYGAVSPDATQLDGIRQYLIVRRQGENWGRPYFTNIIVCSMVESGTPWISTDSRLTVTDGAGAEPHLIGIGKIGAFSMPVGGEELTLTRVDAKAPAYGAVVAHYTAPSTSIKSFSDGEVSIEKQYFVENAAGTLRIFNPLTGVLNVGDKVRIQLTLKSQRPLSNVVVNDNRAATFEPIVQTPGWVYYDGTGAYRENRDAATIFYLDYLPKGTTLLQYEVAANNAGSFNGGVADVTCTQAPDLTAHTAAAMINVEEQPVK